nr:hypothetical protein [Tanacetum cinerariifolium]
MEQPQLVVSTQGALRSPTVSAKEEKDDDDFQDRLEPGSHKENTEVDDDDDNAKKKVEEKKDDKMGSLEFRTEETQTTIPTPPSSFRKILSSDNKIDQELMNNVAKPTITTSKHSQSKRQISSSYSHISGLFHKMCRCQGYMIQNLERKCVTTDKFYESHNKVEQALKEAIQEIVENATNDLIEEDEFHSHHDEHHDDDAPPKGEKRVKRIKESKRSKSTRGSSSKLSSKDSTKYNVDERVSIIFDYERMETKLRDLLSDQFRNAKEYAYQLE